MINNVTDTNVGKMTEEEAIDVLEDDIADLCYGDDDVPSSYPQDRHDAYVMAIEALQFQQSVVKCKDCRRRRYDKSAQGWV